MNEYITVDAKISDCMQFISSRRFNPIQWYCAMMLLYGVLRSLIHDDVHEDEYNTRFEDEEKGKETGSNHQHLEMQNELSFGAAFQVAEDNGSFESSSELRLDTITCDVLMIVASGLLAWTSSHIETPEAAQKYWKFLRAFHGFNLLFTERCEDNWETLADVACRVEKVSKIMSRLGPKIEEQSIHEDEKMVEEASQEDGGERMEKSIHQYQPVKEFGGRECGEGSQEC